MTTTVTPDDPVVVLGDFNVAPEDRDVWDPKKFVGSTHVTPAERDAVVQLEKWGMEDLFRRVYPDTDRLYSYWDYRAGDFHQHRGMRIDLVLGTRPVAERATWAVVDQRPQGHRPVRSRPRDHRPRRLTGSRLPAACNRLPPANSSGASAGTPCSSEAKYASSLVPARKRAYEPSITHASLNEPEHAVVVDVREIAVGVVGVAIEQLASRRHVVRPANGVTPASDAASPDSTHNPSSQPRSTSGSPIVDCSQSTTATSSTGEARREHHVVELVVAVDDARTAASADRLREPLPRFVDLRKRTRLVARELTEPTRHLPFEVAVGAAEAVETACVPVESMDARQRIHQREAHSARRVGSQRQHRGNDSRTTTPSTRCIR